jgi:recombination protein RecA
MAGKTKQDGAEVADPLAAFMAKVNKEHGEGSMLTLNDSAIEVERITTGSIGLDDALGGGLPRGRIVEIYGPESCGKTTVALQAAYRVQQAGGRVFFVDAEYALDPDLCRGIGIDTDQLYFLQPDTGEQGLNVTQDAIECGLFDLIIVDSVAALVPKAEIQGEIGDSFVGLQARLMSQAMRKLVGAFPGPGEPGRRAVVIFINQLRMKIGVQFGSPEDTPGGKALKYYSSVRLDVRRIETLGGHAAAYGNKLRIKVTKNKVAPPFKTAEVDLLFGRGISREGELVDLGVERGVIRKSGSWYIYGDLQIGQGKANAVDWLAANPDIAGEIDVQIRALLASSAPAPVPVVAEVGNPFATT